MRTPSGATGLAAPGDSEAARVSECPSGESARGVASDMGRPPDRVGGRSWVESTRAGAVTPALIQYQPEAPARDDGRPSLALRAGVPRECHDVHAERLRR